MNDDFYIGYVPKAPPSLATWTRRSALALAIGGLATGILLSSGQARFADSRFEYGIYKDYSGVVEEWPVPMLRTQDGSFLLVDQGKHGLSETAKGLSGKSVQLRASLIQRGPDRMLEVVQGSLKEIAPVNLPPQMAASFGSVTLEGEIVDSKCHLGVMNPGEGKVHRDCAARCISGGVPPAFLVRDQAGETRLLLLVGSDGRALNREILSFVAEPVEIQGELVRSGANFILKAEPLHFRRKTE
jgi:hypothetical protein